MLSRALSLATVMLLIGCLTAGVARARENLDAGKSPSQIFSNTCSACHKSPRGLLKSVSASSLPGFLRQHYTTGTDMASVLSSYLISNGAADPRYQSKDQPKQKDAKQDGRPDQPDRLRSPAASRPHLRRRLPGRMPTEAHAARRGRAPGPRCEAARTAAARRPTPPSLRMGRPRCRPRPTANRASGRSRAGVASPPPKNRRKPSRQPGRCLRRKMRRGMPPRLKPPRPIRQDRCCQDRSCQDRRDQDRRDQAAEVDKPASEAAKPAGEVGQIRDRQGRCSQGECRQRADAAPARSGAAGHAGAASFRSDRA